MDISSLIRAHNKGLILKMVMSVILSFVCYYLAYLFFRYTFSFVCDGFRLDLDAHWFVIVPIAILLLMTITYFLSWRKGDDTGDVNDSFFAMGFVEYTAGAVIVNNYTQQLTGPAYVMSAIFHQGPARLIRVYEYYGSRIPDTTEVINKVTLARDSLKSANKWQDVSLYGNQALEVIYLSLLEEIDLDLVKGRIKYSGK